MQTRGRYASIHRAAARPPEGRTQECWEGRRLPRGACSRPCPHLLASQRAAPACSAHAPQRDEGKPPGARRGAPRVRCSMAKDVRGPPPARPLQGIQHSCQGPQGPGYPPRAPSNPQRPTQTTIPGHHFVPHSRKEFLQKGRRGAPNASSCPPISYCLQARPENPGAPRQPQQRPKKIVFEDELPVRNPEVTPGSGPQPSSDLEPHPRHHPQAQLVPDYVLRYPAIYSEAERRRYKAVFQDQHAEYQELHQDVATARAKFQELETLLATLPPPDPKEEARLTRVRREFERKKRDPVFLEKQARCDYLKRKLKHLKAQIQKYDEKDSQDGSVYF
ncbi:occludin/ELL domain-containing protein 1 isoform X1 [Monodelphis domestica]|uniref:Occludin/ELL domain containing 1 n=1 Tax=Monodelphis domestica TaxID=13616 RepID=F7G5C5_MONDO|nr:occludin/ELL domain-containing protein 1 isoform X1 [Monodelphis domestica]